MLAAALAAALSAGWAPAAATAAATAVASGGEGSARGHVGTAGCRAHGRDVPCGEGSHHGAAYGTVNGTAYGVDYGVVNGTDNGVINGVGNGTGNGTAMESGGTELSFLHRSLLAVAATLLISAAAPLAAVLLLCGRCPTLQWVLLQLLLALGAGALSGDALLHLLPQFLELHVHEEGGHEEHAEAHTRVQPWQLLVVLAALFLFFLMERILRIVGGAPQCGRGRRPQCENCAELSTDCAAGEQPPHSALSDDELQRNALRALPLLLTVGDAVHNAADGVALGAAFSASWRSGVGTAVAVLLHELPHELGDMAALLRSGLGAVRAVALNAAAALPALLGVAVGLAVGSDAEAQRWVCGAAAGLFLYVALCDVMPALLQQRSSRPWLLLLLHCVGLLLGWALLALLALLEDHGLL